ncbi:unnamed protein product [Sympodiomycopsis kandeliae]
MGCVCSCFASVFLWTGELLENLFLAIGEIGSILIRGIFSILVSLCDLLASVSCCWRVPYDERPDRQTYQFHNLAQPLSQPRKSLLTKEGRAQRSAEKQSRRAAEQEKKLKLQEQKQQKDLAGKEEKEAKAKAKQEESERKKQEALAKKEKELAEKKAAALITPNES